MRDFRRREQAVTPVVGTILILLISVLGVAAVMAWGAPTIQRIQDRNAMASMLTEFEDLRHNSLRLRVADTANEPDVAIAVGEVELLNGTRIMVTINITDSGGAECPFVVSDWWQAPVDTVTLSAPAPCGWDEDGGDPQGDYDIEVWEVDGSSITRIHHAANNTTAPPNGSPHTVQVAGKDFTQGDWVFQITQTYGNPNATVWGEAWLMDTSQLRWQHNSGENSLRVILEAGLLMTWEGGTYFRQEWPAIQEDVFVSGDSAVLLPTMRQGTGGSSGSGPDTYSIYMDNDGIHLRNSSNAVDGVRYDFYGTLQEPWCNTLVDRNDVIGATRYQAVAGSPCNTPMATGPTAVQYRPVGGADFPFEFFHGIQSISIRTS